MDRNEMLEKLHSITFRANFTVLTSEYCIEADIITGDGSFYAWIGYDDWNVYALDGIETIKWHNIINKIKSNSLELIDIENTVLEKLLPAQQADCNDFFKSLLNAPDVCPNEFYCIVDDDNKIEFFFDEEMIVFELKNRYSSCVKKWDDMDDTDLEHWASICDEYDGIPYCRIDN